VGGGSSKGFVPPPACVDAKGFEKGSGASAVANGFDESTTGLGFVETTCHVECSRPLSRVGGSS
jgi:hypothetical protein